MNRIEEVKVKHKTCENRKIRNNKIVNHGTIGVYQLQNKTYRKQNIINTYTIEQSKVIFRLIF